jgi:hypothetical protein
MNSLHFGKQYHYNKNGAKRDSSWPGTSFWPISFIKRGAKKGGKSSSTKPGFQHQRHQTIPNHKFSTPVVFSGE